MDMLVWFEKLALSVWVRESLFGYPIVLTLHAIGMAAVVGVITVINLRLLGAIESVPLFLLVQLLPLVWAGFAVNAATGLLLFLADAVTLSTNPAFLSKLSAILAGFLIALALRREVRLNAHRRVSGATMPRRAKLLSAASLFVWCTAIALGRYTAYVSEQMIS